MAQLVEHHEDSGHDLSATEARQAVPLGHMRYVLASSLVAVVIVFAFLWLYGVFA
jgi:hypothetical protein